MIKLSAIRFLVIVLTIVQCFTYLPAATLDSLANSQPKSALQLDLVNPTGFFYLMPVSPSTRLRFGLNASIQSNNGNNNYNNSYNDVNPDTSYTDQTSEPGESHSFSATSTFSALYINDFISTGPFSLYAGLGPFVTYTRSYSSSKNTYIGNTISSQDYTNSSYSWTYGAKVAFGIQIDIIKEMGIHAEYGCSVGHQRTLSNGRSTNNNSSQYISSSTSNSNSSNTVWTFSGVTGGLLFFF